MPSLSTISSCEKFPILNPYNNEHVGELPFHTSEEIIQAVIRAKKAANEFRFSTPFQRRELLNKIATLVGKNDKELALTVCSEVGKTITEATGEIRRAQNTLRLSGDAGTFLDGEVLHCGIVNGGVDRQASITYHPTGVIGAITPFNYPVNLLCHKLGPAIAAGNAIIIKPSPKAPLAAQHFVDLCQQAGAPKDLIQIVHGGAKAAIALAESPIDLLSFTGGPEGGLALKRASGLVRCLMELGGNDPLFVLPDGDLDAAVKTAVAQRFEIAGQSCAAVKKLYLHEDIKDSFLQKLMSLVQEIKTGDPRNTSTVMGPVIDETSAQAVMARIENAVQEGAKILFGGKNNKTLIEPTVMDHVSPESDLFKYETFGPIISIRAFNNFDEAIDEVNKTEFGLQAGIFTNSHDKIRKMSRELQVGGIMVNEGPDFRAEHVPFGGVKGSGLGREGVRIAVREMSETRVVID